MRDWLNSILGQDGGRVAQFALALIAVVLLILLLAWIVRRMQPGSKLIAAVSAKGRKRLGVLEASDVDARRRLVLVRRDDVEHLIMIGGPNDLLIESRILRGGHAANRPNVQHMPRPAATDADRLTAPPTGAAPTGSSLPASFPTPQPIAAPIPEPIAAQAPAPAPIPAPVSMQPRPAPIEEVEISFDEVDLEAPAGIAPPPAAAPVPSRPQFAPPSFVPPASRPPMTPATPTPPTPSAPPSMDARRPSLGDLLSAATAAKSANPRDAQQPLTAPPPMPRMVPAAPQPQAAPPPPHHQDLEEDDREMPTQIVARRPVPPRVQPPQSAFEPSTADAADEFMTRETEVTSQIERALADLNPAAAPVETQPRIEPRRPQLEPVQVVAPVAPRPAPAAPMPAPTMPTVPLRPTPPARPNLPERPMMERPAPVDRPAPIERPAAVERPPLLDRVEAPSRPAFEPSTRTEDRTTTAEVNRPFLAAPTPEPATAQRPITAPIPRPPSFAASEPATPAPAPAPAPVPAPAPTPSIQQKTDELEEEMAKLLSELGGSSSR